MQYLLRLSDERGNTMVVLTLSEKIASANAIDIVFDVIGQDDTDQLISEDILATGQLDDLRALQSAIFDRDAQGVLIRDGVSFIVNGRELNPDAPMINSFVLAERATKTFVGTAQYVSPELLEANETSKRYALDCSGAHKSCIGFLE